MLIPSTVCRCRVGSMVRSAVSGGRLYCRIDVGRYQFAHSFNQQGSGGSSDFAKRRHFAMAFVALVHNEDYAAAVLVVCRNSVVVAF
jgi:hypothetical protein